MSKQGKGMIHLPGNKVHQFLHSAPQRKEVPEAFEVYPDEWDKVKAVGSKINEMFQYKNIHNDEWPQLIERIIEMYDAIGFEVGVEIMDASRKVPDGQGGTIDVPVINKDGFPMRVPSVAFLGRSHNKETEIDHDRIAHGVVAGKVDGRKGYIREGSSDLHEDPIKKIII